MPYTATLVITGAASPVGREVARLAIAYGAEVFGVARGGPPDLDEPWIEGVEWLPADDSMSDVPRGALVITDPEDAGALLRRAGEFERVVVVTRPDAAPLVATDSKIVIASPAAVDVSPDRGAHLSRAGAIRVEQLGMALLRAALDDDIPTTLDHDALLLLGDAVMLQ